ncbi:MAG TPA: NADH-quinone oxidoreductase subunit NuoE [Pseudomonadales bacterium]|jgi:NADH-quinone oxidoreductase subunit E|nr:NADH-quinone oxidoreductase subunit NuoE [Gammaproteobacteria bacterium]MDP6027493.1 NADH-quinone oxidoreductase subunit NuoE [Pseudomonadales bacterium]MDP6317056.1 NADH-quinone oxidoreductase subunit NuoE [Pseudomonadales bacterium]MDP7316231.1 NADH-quinone oxidoreductase subunit NuoE [Pseudomonadales bacterium]HJL60528.1 NADH-quinone oxidoreductase subunit NuoE [Pseudomonadales bacterium]|tara:strand:- start:20250 stop:20735 length:486 start_codon:yes stop_codon:yes gene_type:complete
MNSVRNNLASTLTDQEVSEIEAEISHLPDRRSAAIDALKIVQKHRGWISDGSLSAIARLLGMSDEELDGIATFYTLIYRKPVGEKVILCCDSVSCWIMGGDKITNKIKSHLNVELGETTEDSKYTLLPVTCLGDCDHAPAMMVGDELHHDLTESNIEEILK